MFIIFTFVIIFGIYFYRCLIELIRVSKNIWVDKSLFFFNLAHELKIHEFNFAATSTLRAKAWKNNWAWFIVNCFVCLHDMTSTTSKRFAARAVHHLKSPDGKEDGLFHILTNLFFWHPCFRLFFLIVLFFSLYSESAVVYVMKSHFVFCTVAQEWEGFCNKGE